MEDYKKLYEQTQSKMKEFIKRWDGIKLSSNDLFTEELKQIVDIENEDERLRKTAISFLKDFAEQGYENAVECIDWLEKQGEPNPYSGVSFKYNGHTWGMCARDNGVEILVDGEIKERIFLDNEPQDKSALEVIKEEKVDNEPKFKVGDWVVNKFGDSWHIDSLDNKNYQVSNVKGNYNYFPISKQDEMHLWTIQDVKDGDFLCCKSGWMCIFKSLNNYTNTFSSYCFMDSNKCFFNSGGECHTLDKEFINAYNGEIHPATKEQCDILFQKIKEAGYKWNDETKTLEKLIKPKFKIGDKIRHKDTNKDDVYEISNIYDGSYGIVDFNWMIYMKYQDQYELVPNKFDPKTLKPFDKVLVKNDDDITWVAALFSHIIEFHDEVTGNDYLESVTSYCTSSFCIPYNDDTKHLVGTEDEAPEFYKYWED